MRSHWQRVLTAVLMALSIVPLPGIASAHTRSVSYSRWDLDERGARVEARVPAIELTRFEAGEPPPQYFAHNLLMRAGDEPCTNSAVERIEGEPGWIVFRWSVECPHGKARTIASRLLRDVIASHVHFARVATKRGAVHERFLVETEPLWRLPGDEAQPAGAASATIVRYIGLGVGHIAAGWDHLAFLLALLLLSSSLAEVTLLVTAFTLAHSLTLALAVSGVVHPEATAVETVIGFSIALVAAENAWLLAGRDRAIQAACIAAAALAATVSASISGTLSSIAWLGLAGFSYCHFGLLAIDTKPARIRAAVAFGFGLVHGLGFAGVLMEMELPASELMRALFGFNTGVEIGQLMVVAAVYPLLAALAQYRSNWHRLVVETGSAAILALGVFWVVVRGWA